MKRVRKRLLLPWQNVTIVMQRFQIYIVILSNYLFLMQNKVSVLSVLFLRHEINDVKNG